MDEAKKLYGLASPAPRMDGVDGDGPILVHALEGFADAGGAVRLAAAHLKETLAPRVFASFAIDELLDYRSRRPLISFKEDHFADYEDPELTLYAMKDATGRPFLLLSGLEPDLKWEAFIAAIRQIADELNVSQVIGLNAIPLGTPHTRPLGVTAHSNRPERVKPEQRWNWSKEVKLPSSLSALLEFRMIQHGYNTIGYSVHIPHYLAQAELPAAAKALLTQLGDAGSLKIPLEALDQADRKVRADIDAEIAKNPEAQALVAALEGQYDRSHGLRGAELPSLSGDDLPDSEQIGAEIEAFLAGQMPDDETPDDDER